MTFNASFYDVEKY